MKIGLLMILILAAVHQAKSSWPNQWTPITTITTNPISLSSKPTSRRTKPKRLPSSRDKVVEDKLNHLVEFIDARRSPIAVTVNKKE